MNGCRLRHGSLAVAKRYSDATAASRREKSMSINSIAQPDVTLFLDGEGVIQKATLSRAVGKGSMDAWLGRRWEETVGDIGGEKIRRMIADARSIGVSGFRQVTQLFPSGLELPMEYTTVRLGQKAGLIAVGKNLKAVAELQSRLVSTQQTMERDYWKLREIETRYRHLLDASDEAVLLLNAQSLRIVEANPAAAKVLGTGQRRREDVASKDLLADFLPPERQSFNAMLRIVREQGKAPAIVIRLGRERQPWIVRASLINSEQTPLFLVRLSPVGGAQQRLEDSEPLSMQQFMERLPDGFVVIDHDGVVRRANRAFLDMIEIGAKGSVVGERLGRWLWRPGADLALLVANVRRHGSVRLFSTTIHGELGSETEVEISATGNAAGKAEFIGLLVRDISRRVAAQGDGNRLLSALGPITEQVGRTSLRSLVDETVGVVERHYVKAALDLAGGNRTAAAEILGLSRQSLYAKLNRYNLDKELENTEGGD
jgi:transcriptional regulator PpsR